MMPGIVKGETSSKDNPLLPFFFQYEGILRDIYSLSFSIYPHESGTAVTGLSNVTVNVTPNSSPSWISQGCYAPSIATTTLSEGPYDIVWAYKYQSSDAELKASYSFEVLAAGPFRFGSQYAGYVLSDNALFSGYTRSLVQKAICDMSQEVDRICGRFFFPKYMTVIQSVRPRSSIANFVHPIIGVNSIAIDSILVYMTTPSYYNLDVGNIKVFNRHLSGYTAEDDRDGPKIVIATAGSTADRNAVTIGSFPGGTKNLRVRGVWGYTDPDGSPFGCTPRPLQEVVESLVYRRLQDPSGTDISLWFPNRVTSAKTRDQSLSMASGSAMTLADSLTGNPRLDDILGRYCRPAYVGSAGLDSE
jgi:hypothetical protein